MNNTRLNFISTLLLAWCVPAFAADVVPQQPGEIQTHVKNLVNGNTHEQREAMGALKTIGKPAVSPLLDVLLKNPNRNVKSRARNVLKELFRIPGNRDERTLSRLTPRAFDVDYTVSDAALSLMAEFRGSNSARETIRDAIRRHGNEIIRGKAIGALVLNSGRSQKERAFVKGFLGDRSWFVRIRAAKALGRLGDDAGLPHCEELLRKPPTREWLPLQIEAVEALGLIGDPKAIPALERVSRTEEFGLVRQRAILAIKNIEIKHLPTAQQKKDYLAVALRVPISARWAAYRLEQRGDAAAIRILREASKDADNPEVLEAKRALSRMQVDVD